jgi:hypothetical protein
MKKAALIVTVLGLVFVTAYARATIPDPEGIIHGCRSASTGLVRIIDTDTTPSCTRAETAVQWSQTGPQGIQGLQGPQGPKGDHAARQVV